MKRPIIVITFVLTNLFCAFSLGQQSKVETILDRTVLELGETINLRILVLYQKVGLKLDLEPLRENFDVLFNRTHLSGPSSFENNYELVLRPRVIGEYQVPELVVGNETTDEFTITVTEPTLNWLGACNDAFLETILSSDSVFEQDKLLLTVRLYYSVDPIRNPVFTEIAPQNAVVQMPSAPRQSEQLVEGVLYKVHERNYEIFPHRSGELVIPDFMFYGQFYYGAGRFHRPITAFAEGYTVVVKERHGISPLVLGMSEGRTLAGTADYSNGLGVEAEE